MISALDNSTSIAELAEHGFVDRGILTPAFNGFEVQIVSLPSLSSSASKEERRSFYVGLLTKKLGAQLRNNSGNVSVQPLFRYGAGTGSVKINETIIGSKTSCETVGDVITVYVTKLDTLNGPVDPKTEVNVVICKNYRRIFSHPLKTCVIGADGEILTYGLVPFVSVRKTGVRVKILNFIPASMSAAASTASLGRLLSFGSPYDTFQLIVGENSRITNDSKQMGHVVDGQNM